MCGEAFGGCRSKESCDRSDFLGVIWWCARWLEIGSRDRLWKSVFKN